MIMKSARLALGAIILLGALPALGVETKVLRDDTFAHFNQGQSTGTEILSQGRLRVAPKAVRLDKTEEGVAWRVAVDRFDKEVFYCTGHNGKVFRYVPGGKSELWADLTEVEAISLAIDPTGGVLIGASPGGKIYRVVQAGKPQLFFDTKEQYIWDMIFDRDGILYAATGANGKIFRIRGQNNGEVFYDSDATNIMALNFDRDGNLIAATQGKGYVLRITSAGSGYVLYASPEDECRALAVDHNGNIYAAVNGSRGTNFDSAAAASEEKFLAVIALATASSPSAMPTPRPDGSSAPASPPTVPSASGASNAQSFVVQIQPSGFVQNFWPSPEAPIQAMLSDPETTGILVAAGKKGKIFRLGDDANYSVVADIEEPMVLSFAASGNHVYFSTANKASLYELSAEQSREGIFASRAFNGGSTVKWGNIYYEAEEPAGSEITFETRSGNTAEPEDKTWGPWAPAVRVGPRIVRVESPVAQYLEYRATLRQPSGSDSPSLDSVQAFYVQKNAPPILKDITAEKVGGESQGALFAQMAALARSGGSRTATVSPRSTPSSSSSAHEPGISAFLGAVMPGSSSSGGYPSRSGDSSSEKGSGSSVGVPENSQKLAIAWEASDPNGDKLTSRLYFKGEDETVWKLIEKDLTTNNFTFSTEAIPDGKYRFKVDVSDMAENPEESASTVSLTSRVCIVDNSPPDITDLKGVKVGPNEFEITASTTDSTSIISAAEYNIDAAKEWRAIVPEDGIFDFNQETFKFHARPEKEGPEHTLSLRVFDREGNSRVAKALLK